MYLFFGDERKSNGCFSLVLFKIEDYNTFRISQLCKELRLKYNLPQSYEFHYHKDSRTIKKIFTNFIQTLPIEAVFYTKIHVLNEPQSHICAFKELIPVIAKNINDSKAKFIFDKLGGPKTETILRTEFSNFVENII
jgi:hypothetical protein